LFVLNLELLVSIYIMDYMVWF